MVLAVSRADPKPVILWSSTSLLKAVARLVSENRYHAVVLDPEARPIGVFSSKDAARAIAVEAEEGIGLLEYPDLREALDSPVKLFMNSKPLAMPVHASLWEVVSLMIEKNTGCVPLISEEGKLEAIVTEHSIAPLAGEIGSEILVDDIMSSPLIAVEPSAWIIEALGLMLARKVRRLGVLEGRAIRGIVTVNHALSVLLDKNSLSALSKGSSEPLERPVADVVEEPLVVKSGSSVSDVAEYVALDPTGSALIVSEGEAVGIVTLRDLVNAVYMYGEKIE